MTGNRGRALRAKGSENPDEMGLLGLTLVEKRDGAKISFEVHGYLDWVQASSHFNVVLLSNDSNRGYKGLLEEKQLQLHDEVKKIQVVDEHVQSCTFRERVEAAFDNVDAVNRFDLRDGKLHVRRQISEVSKTFFTIFVVPMDVVEDAQDLDALATEFLDLVFRENRLAREQLRKRRAEFEQLGEAKRILHESSDKAKDTLEQIEASVLANVAKIISDTKKLFTNYFQEDQDEAVGDADNTGYETGNSDDILSSPKEGPEPISPPIVARTKQQTTELTKVGEEDENSDSSHDHLNF